MQAHKEIEIEPIAPQERLSTNSKPPSMIFYLSSFGVLLSVELPELLLQRIMQLMATKEDNVSSLLEISQVSTDQNKQYGKL